MVGSLSTPSPVRTLVLCYFAAELANVMLQGPFTSVISPSLPTRKESVSYTHLTLPTNSLV